MFVNYLKDVSALLAIIRSVRECNIEMHLEAERALPPQLFVFDHPNYSRYLTYQHALLEVYYIIKHVNLEVSTKHVYRNKEAKVRRGPMKGEYSTKLDAMNIFLKNSHLLAKLRSALRERIHLLTSSEHKEITLAARKKHENMIKRLITKLGEVLDPFSSRPAKSIESGVLLDDLIVKGLLKSEEIGEKRLQDFILKRMKANKNDAVSFFEEKKALGLLVAKEKSPEEVYNYLLTTLSLALSDPSGNLQQS